MLIKCVLGHTVLLKKIYRKIGRILNMGKMILICTLNTLKVIPNIK